MCFWKDVWVRSLLGKHEVLTAKLCLLLPTPSPRDQRSLMTSPLLQPRKWKWEEECHWLSLLQFPWNYHTDLSLVPSYSPSILHCASLSQACSKVLLLDSTFICSLLFVSRHTMAMYMVETWTSIRAFLPLSCKHRLDVSQIASLSWELVALEVKSISQSGGLSHSSLLVSRHPQAICQ